MMVAEILASPILRRPVTQLAEARESDAGPKDNWHTNVSLMPELPLPRPAPGTAEDKCVQLPVHHVTIRGTERLADEPTLLARMCSMAVELEAVIKRNGFGFELQLDTQSRLYPITLLIHPRRESK